VYTPDKNPGYAYGGIKRMGSFFN